MQYLSYKAFSLYFQISFHFGKNIMRHACTETRLTIILTKKSIVISICIKRFSSIYYLLLIRNNEDNVNR